MSTREEELKERVLGIIVLNQDRHCTKDDFETYEFRINTDLREAYIKIGKMYDSPVINFKLLKELGDLFNTLNINVDDYNFSGCESCDWGSDYGHEIFIKEIGCEI